MCGSDRDVVLGSCATPKQSEAFLKPSCLSLSPPPPPPAMCGPLPLPWVESLWTENSLSSPWLVRQQVMLFPVSHWPLGLSAWPFHICEVTRGFCPHLHPPPFLSTGLQRPGWQPEQKSEQGWAATVWN